MNALTNDSFANPKLIDPLYFTIMKDPVVLSSGIIMDKSTVLTPEGTLRFTKCPMTRQTLDRDVFSVNYIKSQIVDWTKNRVKTLLQMAEMYKNDQSKYDRILDHT